MLLGSKEWWEKAKEVVNGDAEYFEAAKNIRKTYTFRVQAEPENGIPNDILMGYKIDGGKIVEYWDADRPTDFVISGPYKVWHQIMKGEMGPIKAMTMRKLAIKGSLPELLKDTKATIRWVALLQTIPTEFHGNYR
jgi:putative sterol carrier protein